MSCGAGGAGTASEIALALKSDKFVVLLKGSKESRAFFKKIGGRLAREADSVSKTIDIVRLLLAKMGKDSTRAETDISDSQTDATDASSRSLAKCMGTGYHER